MDELEKAIKEILGDDRVFPSRMISIKIFIDKCSLSDFEKLKDLDYDLNNQTDE